MVLLDQWMLVSEAGRSSFENVPYVYLHSQDGGSCVASTTNCVWNIWQWIVPWKCYLTTLN